MPTLPPSPSLDQLRHQAKELLRAANAGDGAAISRIEAVSDRVTLAAAQLALRVSRPDSTRAPAGLRFTPSVLHDGIKSTPAEGRDFSRSRKRCSTPAPTPR